MPEDLDDFDIEPTRRDQETVRETLRTPGAAGGDGPRGGIGFPMILAAVAVLVIAALGVLFLVFQKPGKPAATPVPLAAGAGSPLPTAPPALPLPPPRARGAPRRG